MRHWWSVNMFKCGHHFYSLVVDYVYRTTLLEMNLYEGDSWLDRKKNGDLRDDGFKIKQVNAISFWAKKPSRAGRVSKGCFLFKETVFFFFLMNPPRWKSRQSSSSRKIIDKVDQFVSTKWGIDAVSFGATSSFSTRCIIPRIAVFFFFFAPRRRLYATFDFEQNDEREKALIVNQVVSARTLSR